MADEKRCSTCGQWTVWTKQPNDLCSHYNGALSSTTVETVDTSSTNTFAKRPSFLTVRADDGVMMRGIRKTALAAHVVYAGIMWLFMMLFAALVH